MTNYIANTRGIITASKLKVAEESLKAYDIIFNQTDDETAQSIEDSKKSYFAFGTMAHKLLEGYNTKDLSLKEIIDLFLQEYNITNKYQKKELVTMIVEVDKANAEHRDDSDSEARAKELRKAGMTLDKLREIRHGADAYADIVKRKKITMAEARDLIIGASENPNIADSILKVAVMNKDRDMGGTYTCEERIQARYKGMILGAKPDRLVFYKEGKEDIRITLEELGKIIEGMDRDTVHEWAKREGIKGVIRDYKTSGDARKVYHQIRGYGDTDTSYVFSMAFYYLIVRITYGVKCDVKLDIIESRSPFVNYVHTIPEEIMVAKVSKITRILDSILKAQESEKRGILGIEDLFEGRILKQYYPILAQHIDSTEVFVDVAM